MPLNLSTKPSPPSSSSLTNHSTPPIQSRSNAIIWSPASMCEKETAESYNNNRDNIIKYNNNNESVNNNRSVNNIGVRYSLNNNNNNCANQITSNNNLNININDNINSSNDIHRHYGDSSSSGPEDSPTFIPTTSDLYASAFSQKAAAAAAAAAAATGFFSHFHKNKDLSMLRQNRTDVFVVNNNNDFLRDKEMTRPDSTAHHSDISVKTEHEDHRKREHRCFQVRIFFLNF